MTTEKLLQCLNPNCGKRYSSEQNHPTACTHHATPPVFRNGVKIWVCCNKEAWDWDEFLAIQGCCTGYHSAIKPADTNKAVTEPSGPIKLLSQPIVEPKANDAIATTVPSTVAELDHKRIVILDNGNYQCTNKGCLQQFNPSENNETACKYHPGNAIFRDTRKSWSCCNTGSYDWDEFVLIKPCAIGPHVPKVA